MSKPAPRSPRSEGPLARPAGQERALRTLQASLRRGTVPHAYLFEGPAGVGKEAAARWLSAALLCEAALAAEAPGDTRPCGGCAACRGVARGTHPDLMVLEPPAERRRILIAQVRELIARVVYAPLRGRHRVVLVRDADRMDPVPANALLKTLEEPAPYNTFVLLASRPEALLDTLRSRCQRVRFSPLPATLVSTRLREAGLPDDAARVLAAAGGGSIGRSRVLAEAGFAEQSRIWLDRYLLPAAAGAERSSPAEVLDDAADLAAELRRDPDRQTGALALLLLSLELGLRDAVLLAAGRAPEHCTFPDRVESSRALARRLGVTGAIRLLDRVREAEECLHRPLNARLVVEALLLHLRARMDHRGGPRRVR